MIFIGNFLLCSLLAVGDIIYFNEQFIGPWRLNYADLLFDLSIDFIGWDRWLAIFLYNLSGAHGQLS